MSTPRAIKLIAIVLAGGVAVALLLESGSRMLQRAGGVDFASDGDGAVVTQQRALQAFDAIEVRDQADLEVTVGAAQTVTVQAREPLLPQLVTRVDGQTLIVDSGSSGVHFHLFARHDASTPRIAITVPSLTALNIQGAGRFKLHQLKGEHFDLQFEGAGKLSADGAVGALKMNIEGAAEVDASALQAQSAEVSIGGAGLVMVRAQDALTASVDGIGRIVYFGNPHTVDKHVSGLGSIQQGTPDAAAPG